MIRQSAGALALVISFLFLNAVQAGIYDSAVLADSPMAYWRFNEVSGTTVTDSSGNGHHATYFNGSVNSVGGIDGSSSFLMDGSNDYIKVDNVNPFLLNNQSVTLEAWVQIPDNTNVYRQFFFLGNTSGTYIEMGKSRSGANSGSFFLQEAGTNGSSTLRSNVDSNWTGPNMPKNEWIHLVGVFDTALSLMSFYINGDLIAQGATGGYDLTAASGIDFLLGSSQNGACCHSTPNGAIDEFAFYTHALSADRIEAHYNAGIGASSSIPSPASVLLLLLSVGLMKISRRRRR